MECAAGLQPQEAPSNTNNQQNGGATPGNELPTDFSLPLTSGAPQSFVDLPLVSLTPQDVQADGMLQDDLVKNSHTVLGTGGVGSPFPVQVLCMYISHCMGLV